MSILRTIAAKGALDSVFVMYCMSSKNRIFIGSILWLNFVNDTEYYYCIQLWNWMENNTNKQNGQWKKN